MKIFLLIYSAVVTGVTLGVTGAWVVAHRTAAPVTVVRAENVPVGCDQRTAFFEGDGDIVAGCARLAGEVR
jgi:hypothetical protein